MSRLTDNDKNFGPFTIGRWRGSISASFYSHDEDYNRSPCNHLRFIAFGWALRIRMPRIIKAPCMEYGFSLSRQGESYDFLQVFFGPQTFDSLTTKCWSKFLPWTQWDHVRYSVYTPDGSHYGTEPHGKGRFEVFANVREACPKVKFDFLDYDGKRITATCHIEEREWNRGEGWFKWLRFFYKPMIRRSLDLWFSEEVGPGKGSWKGGTIGTGCDMLRGDTPEDAFKRWCLRNHSHKGNNYSIRFMGATPKLTTNHNTTAKP